MVPTAVFAVPSYSYLWQSHNHEVIRIQHHNLIQESPAFSETWCNPSSMVQWRVNKNGGLYPHGTAYDLHQAHNVVDKWLESSIHDMHAVQPEKLMSHEDISKHFNCSPGYVGKMIRRFLDTGFLGPYHQGGNPGRTKLGWEHSVYLNLLSGAYPDLYLHECQHHLHMDTGLEVDESTICRTLKWLGLTRKKKQVSAIEKHTPENLAYYTDYVNWMKGLNEEEVHRVVHLDETGARKNSAMRRYMRDVMGRDGP